MVRCGMVWLVWYGMVWYSVELCGMLSVCSFMLLYVYIYVILYCHGRSTYRTREAWAQRLLVKSVAHYILFILMLLLLLVVVFSLLMLVLLVLFRFMFVAVEVRANFKLCVDGRGAVPYVI